MAVTRISRPAPRSTQPRASSAVGERVAERARQVRRVLGGVQALEGEPPAAGLDLAHPERPQRRAGSPSETVPSAAGDERAAARPARGRGTRPAARRGGRNTCATGRSAPARARPADELVQQRREPVVGELVDDLASRPATATTIPASRSWRRPFESSGSVASSSAASCETGAGPRWPSRSTTRSRSGCASAFRNSTRPQELRQHVRELLRRLFGHVVAGVDPRALQRRRRPRRPRSPAGRRRAPPCRRARTRRTASGTSRGGRRRGRTPRDRGRRARRRGTRPPSSGSPPGSVTARSQSAWFSAPIASGSPRYQASGSRTIQSSAGFSVCAKKNQCHQLAAKRASQRSSASAIGMPSSTTSRVTSWSSASRWATPTPRSWPTAA